jgi:thiol-disulfide isomerase/thioredoxin
MVRVYYVFVLLFFSSTISGQVKVGERVLLEEMKLQPVTASRINTSKFMVVDFWATWCAPCIASFPHLDSLQKKYAESVQIVAVSDESNVKVSNFLAQKKYTFDFYIDPQKNLFNLFDIQIRPTTCILQPDGTLIWIGNSADVESILQECTTQGGLSNQFPNKPGHAFQKYYQNVIPDEEDNYIYQYQISISGAMDEYEAKTQKGSYADSSINIYYRAVPITEVLQDLLNVSDLQFTNNRPELDTMLINLTAISNTNNISYNNEVENIIADLQKIFDFKLKKENSTVDAYLLTVVDSTKLLTFQEQIPGGGMVESTQEQYRIMRLSLQELSVFFQRKLKSFVAYEGNEKTKFNLELLKFSHPEALNRELKDKYGLSLEKGQIKIMTIEIN